MNSNGIYLAHKTDNGVQSIHIDEEVLWFVRLNKMIGNRISAAISAANKRNVAAKKQRDTKKRYAVRKMKDLRSTVKWSAAMFALAAGLLASHFMGYIVPFIALPGAAVCLCIASCKIGLFVGLHQRKEKHHE